MNQISKVRNGDEVCDRVLLWVNLKQVHMVFGVASWFWEELEDEQSVAPVRHFSAPDILGRRPLPYR